MANELFVSGDVLVGTKFWGSLSLQSTGLIPTDCLKILNRTALRGKSNHGTCDDIHVKPGCQVNAVCIIGCRLTCRYRTEV